MGDIADDVASNIVSHELTLPTQFDFSTFDLVFSVGGRAGGDWLWETSHIPSDSGPGTFRLFVADDSGEEPQGWEVQVDAEHFFDAVVRSIKKQSQTNQDRAKKLLNHVAERARLFGLAKFR